MSNINKRKISHSRDTKLWKSLSIQLISYRYYENVAMHYQLTFNAYLFKTLAARQVSKCRACDVGEAKEGLENEL